MIYKVGDEQYTEAELDGMDLDGLEILKADVEAELRGEELTVAEKKLEWKKRTGPGMNEIQYAEADFRMAQLRFFLAELNYRIRVMS